MNSKVLSDDSVQRATTWILSSSVHEEVRLMHTTFRSIEGPLVYLLTDRQVRDLSQIYSGRSARSLSDQRHMDDAILNAILDLVEPAWRHFDAEFTPQGTTLLFEQVLDVFNHLGILGGLDTYTLARHPFVRLWSDPTISHQRIRSIVGETVIEYLPSGQVHYLSDWTQLQRLLSEGHLRRMHGRETIFIVCRILDHLRIP